MNPMTEAQKASLNRHVKRAVGRIHHGKDPSLYIRLAESHIYHGKPLHKALLKEVVFMRLTDLHEGDTRIPKNTPWSGDYRKYEGWTYASQKYLANRVGSKDPSYVGEVLREIEADGFLRSRSYSISGRGSQRRKQYFPLEADINAKIIELGMLPEEDDEAGTDNSDGEVSPQGLSHPVAVVIPSRPQGLNPPDRSGLTAFPQGLNPKKEALEYASEEGVRGRLLSPPPIGVAEELPSLRSEMQKPKATPTSTPQKVCSVVVDGLKPETKATPKANGNGLAAYLDDKPTPAPARFGRMATFPDDDPELDGVTTQPSAPRAFVVQEA